MPAKAFGFTAYRLEQTASIRAERLAQADRRQQLHEFDRFLKAQRERIAKDLRQATLRIQRATWTVDPSEHGGLFIVTAKGTTEASMPIRRIYQDQER